MVKSKELPERYYHLQKAFDRALWLNFSHRVQGEVFGVIPSHQRGYLVAPTSHPTFKREEFIHIPEVHSYQQMSYQDIEQIRSDTEPLYFWEHIYGMFSSVDGEILRFILAQKVPLEKFIRQELAARGFDKNHRWCGFDKAKDIWLK